MASDCFSVAYFGLLPAPSSSSAPFFRNTNSFLAFSITSLCKSPQCRLNAGSFLHLHLDSRPPSCFKRKHFLASSRCSPKTSELTMPTESIYPPVDIPNVGLWDFLFERKDRTYPDNKSASPSMKALELVLTLFQPFIVMPLPIGPIPTQMSRERP